MGNDEDANEVRDLVDHLVLHHSFTVRHLHSGGATMTDTELIEALPPDEPTTAVLIAHMKAVGWSWQQEDAVLAILARLRALTAVHDKITAALDQYDVRDAQERHGAEFWSAIAKAVRNAPTSGRNET